MPNRFFLYHADCEDGFASALVAWQIFGASARYVPLAHGDPPPDLPSDASVVMTDFSYKRAVLVELAESVADFLVLDHHETAQKELSGLAFAHFDMEKSGATLAWDHWHPGESPPELIRYVEDRDLWRFALPKSRDVNAAISSYPFEFEVWDKFQVHVLAEEGKHVLRATKQQVVKQADRAVIQDVGGYPVPVVNASSYNSDLLAELNQRYPDALFAACYVDIGDGKRRWSLASVGDFDVGSLASSLGGGGLYHRSGFVQDIQAQQPTKCN